MNAPGNSSLPPRARRLFRLPFRRRDLREREMDDEIRAHLAMRIDQLVAQGLARDAAEREALRRFGPIDEARAMMLHAAETRDERLTMLDHVDAIRHDVAYALRQIRRAPALSAAVVVTLALGIGANATMFGIIDRLMLRAPAHVVAPERVMSVGQTEHYAAEEYRNTAFSYPEYKDYRTLPAFEQVAAATYPGDMALGRGEGARKVQGMLVTDSYFPLTGARPALGRFFLPEENAEPSGLPVAVVSYGFWQRELGGRPDAIGRALDIGQRRYTVVGVAPNGFTGLQPMTVDVFIPIAAGEGLRFAGRDWNTTRNSMWLAIDARLRPGATKQQAEAQATAMLRATKRNDAGRVDTLARSSLQSIMPGSEDKPSAELKIARLLGGVAAIVLLVACANVANLLLARAAQRRREIAVRLALGVGRARLVRQLLVESVVLALIGGAAALLVVQWGGGLVRRYLLGNYSWEGSAVDGRLLAFTALATVVTGLLAGLAPAIQGSAPELSRALKEGAREGSPHRSRTRTALLVAQAALSVVLLVGTGLFVRSLRNVNAIQLGMQTNQVLVATMDLRGAGFEPARIEATVEQLLARAQRVPGIESAAIASSTPFHSSYAGSFSIPGRDSVPHVKDGGPYVVAVTPAFFRAVGLRIVRGRPITEEDRASHRRVMVVSESMARLFWPGADPIGRCVHYGADSLPCTEIVGIAENTKRNGVLDTGDILMYYVQLQHAMPFMGERVLLMRPASGEPERYIEPVRRALQTAAPNLPYADVRPMRQLLEHQLRPWELGATMFGAFGGLALLLAAVGLYSVIAYGVSQRLHEMGVRVALGAQRRDILGLVVRQGLALAAVGGALGLLVARAAGGAVREMLFEESPGDPIVFAGVTGVLLVVAVAATLIPAVRATRVDPAAALRSD